MRVGAYSLAAPLALAASGALGQTLVTHRLPATLAVEAATAAVADCAQRGFGVTATVVDADAQRIAMLRGDTAGVHTFEASWSKAYTAVAFAPMFKLESGGAGLAQYSAQQPSGTLPFQPPEHMIIRAGGLTIKLGDEVIGAIGAIGVGGAPSAEADEACAKAGLDTIRNRIR